MSGEGSSDSKDEASASWASEGLPLAVRRELLERDLKKLGPRVPHPSAAPEPAQAPDTAAGSRAQAEGGEAHPL